MISLADSRKLWEIDPPFNGMRSSFALWTYNFTAIFPTTVEFSSLVNFFVYSLISWVVSILEPKLYPWDFCIKSLLKCYWRKKLVGQKCIIQTTIWLTRSNLLVVVWKVERTQTDSWSFELAIRNFTSANSSWRQWSSHSTSSMQFLWRHSY